MLRCPKVQRAVPAGIERWQELYKDVRPPTSHASSVQVTCRILYLGTPAQHLKLAFGSISGGPCEPFDRFVSDRRQVEACLQIHTDRRKRGRSAEDLGLPSAPAARSVGPKSSSLIVFLALSRPGGARSTSRLQARWSLMSPVCGALPFGRLI
jgi:hypothetical protein